MHAWLITLWPLEVTSIWISYHVVLVQAVLLEFGRPTNTAEAPVQRSRQTSKTSDIGLSKTNNKIGNLGRSQNPRQKATGPRGYNTILWSIAVTIDSKTYKRTEFYYLLFCHNIVTYQAYFWHPPSSFQLKVFQLFKTLYVCTTFLCKRLLKCFVLITLCCKSKHLRILVRDLLRDFEWLGILGFTIKVWFENSASSIFLILKTNQKAQS